LQKLLLLLLFNALLLTQVASAVSDDAKLKSTLLKAMKKHDTQKVEEIAGAGFESIDRDDELQMRIYDYLEAERIAKEKAKADALAAQEAAKKQQELDAVATQKAAKEAESQKAIAARQKADQAKKDTAAKKAAQDKKIAQQKQAQKAKEAKARKAKQDKELAAAAALAAKQKATAQKKREAATKKMAQDKKSAQQKQAKKAQAAKARKAKQQKDAAAAAALASKRKAADKKRREAAAKKAKQDKIAAQKKAAAKQKAAAKKKAATPKRTAVKTTPKAAVPVAVTTVTVVAPLALSDIDKKLVGEWKEVLPEKVSTLTINDNGSFLLEEVEEDGTLTLKGLWKNDKNILMLTIKKVQRNVHTRETNIHRVYKIELLEKNSLRILDKRRRVTYNLSR